MSPLEATDAGDCAAVARFAGEQGYVFLPRLIEPEAVRSLAETVGAAWSAARGDTLALHRAVLPSPELERVRRHPALLAAVECILGECRPGFGDVVRCVRPGEAPTPPHQDANYVRGQPTWTAWLPLDDCPLELGPLEVWAGSHRLGALEHEGDRLATAPKEEENWRSSALARGDVILFHGRTVHRAAPNRTNRVRRSVDLRWGRAAG